MTSKKPSGKSSANRSASTPAPSALLKSFIEQGLPPSLLIVSSDHVRRERALSTLLASLTPTPTTRSYRAQDLKPLKLADELSSLSLFSPRKLFVIKDVHTLTADPLNAFLPILDTVQDNNFIILTAQKLPSTGTFLKKMRSLQRCIEFAPLEGDDLRRWTTKELNSRHLTCESPNVLEHLIHTGEESPDLIAGMVETLSLYLDEGPQSVTLDHLTTLFPSSYNAHEFDLADAIASGDVARMELLTAKLMRSEKSLFTIIPLLARTVGFCGVIAVGLSRGRTSEQISAQLGVTAWQLNRYIPMSRKYSISRYERHAAALLRADSKLKNWSLGPENILSELLRELAS